MKIGVIGTGRVGATLGKRWAQAGHAVTFGSRDPLSAKAQQLVEQTGGAVTVRTVAEALHDADVLLLAIPFGSTSSVAALAGDWSGRVVIDCSNPLKPDLSGLTVEPGTSAAEQIAAQFPGAHIVKAFNVASSATMANPLFDSQKATLFYCGDEAAAKEKVRQLIADLDFEPVDAGPLTHARYLESLAMLYIHLAVRGGWGSQCAFRMIRR